MAETTITAKALRSFAQFVMGHGIVSGDPDAEDGKQVEVPESQVEAFVKAGYIADPTDPFDETLVDDADALAEMIGADGLSDEEREAEAEMEAAVLDNADAPPPAAPVDPVLDAAEDKVPVADEPAPIAPAKSKK